MQDWAYDEEGQLILAGLLCLDVSEVRTFDPPRLMKCHGSGGSQQWSLGVSPRSVGGVYCHQEEESVSRVLLCFL